MYSLILPSRVFLFVWEYVFIFCNTYFAFDNVKDSVITVVEYLVFAEHWLRNTNFVTKKSTRPVFVVSLTFLTLCFFFISLSIHIFQTLIFINYPRMHLDIIKIWFKYLIFCLLWTNQILNHCSYFPKLFKSVILTKALHWDDLSIRKTKVFQNFLFCVGVSVVVRKQMVDIMFLLFVSYCLLEQMDPDLD